MKKRLPVIVSFVLFMLLCGSATYWFINLFKTPQARPLAAGPVSNQVEIPPDAATRLFGGQLTVATASNYTLTGVIAGRGGSYGAAILVADGKPARALAVGQEISPGVSLKEVHPQYVMLSENGALKRVNLPEAKGAQLEVANLGQPEQTSRMTGPALPVPQPNAPLEPPQSPQQVEPLQEGVQQPPPPQEPAVGPNGELITPPNPQHNK